MKKLPGLVVLAGALGMAAGTALAQAKDISGTWQGTLEAGKSLRVVLKIAKGDDGGWKSTLYSIDTQGGTPIPVSSTKLDGSSVKLLVIPGISYEGKLTADGSEIDGSWNQGQALPLNLKHVTEAASWTIPAAPKMEPMAKTADPGFEVATIKPSKPDQQGRMITLRAGNIVTINTSLGALISFAYDLQPKQIEGGPAWVEADKYDVTVKPDTPGIPDAPQFKGVIKKLLADRFELKYHTEKKELPVYALEPGKGDAKLTKADADAGSLPGLGFQGLGKLVVHNAKLEDFTQLMQSAVLDRPVVDQTGLTGRFDFTLNWTPDESQFGGMGLKVPPPSDKADAPPPLFTAIQEQLGLKLVPTKAMVDVMVIDKVEKPSDN
jgi:uncharacterized protein (TIGR03435 family)